MVSEASQCPPSLFILGTPWLRDGCFRRFWGPWFPLWKCQWAMYAPQVSGWWSSPWLWLKAFARELAAFGMPWLAQASLDLENLELMQRWINRLKTQIASSDFHRGQTGNVAKWKTARWQTGADRPQVKGTAATQPPLRWSFRIWV